MEQSGPVPITRKQQLCNKLINEADYLQSQYTHLNQTYPQIFTSDSKQINDIQSLQQKLYKIKNLNLKLQKDEEKLKLQFIMLLKEKHTFVNKLKHIENLGENFNWDDQSGILQKIKPLIEATKKRLKQSKVNGSQKS